EPCLGPVPPAAGLVMGSRETCQDIRQALEARCTSPLMQGRFSRQELSKLAQTPCGQIVAGPFPIRRQPPRPEALPETADELRTARRDPLIADVNIRVESTNAGVDRVEGSTLRHGSRRYHRRYHD